MKRSTWWMIIGIISAIGGILALVDPIAGTLAATAIAAWTFIVGGIMCIIAVFTAPGAGNKFMLALFGALSTALGVSIAMNPGKAILALTLAVGIMVIAGGVFRMISAFDFKGTSAFWMLILSSFASFILGFMIFAGYPESSVAILGILLGVELLFSGFSMIALSSTAKQLES